MSRLWIVASAIWLAACGNRSNAAQLEEPPRTDGVKLPDEGWRAVLTPDEFHVLREAGTERAFTGDLWDHHAEGVYVCAGCGLPLFDSAAKFDSGTGWPSFFQPVASQRVGAKSDFAYGMKRTESVCARCGGHLGHVFDDGPQPTGLRYCMNSVSLDFVPRNELAAWADTPLRLGGVDTMEVKK